MYKKLKKQKYVILRTVRLYKKGKVLGVYFEMTFGQIMNQVIVLTLFFTSYVNSDFRSIT